MCHGGKLPFGRHRPLEQQRNIAAFEMSLYCAMPFRQFPPDHFKRTV
jgi:hypothetical protein